MQKFETSMADKIRTSIIITIFKEKTDEIFIKIRETEIFHKIHTVRYIYNFNEGDSDIRAMQ